MYKNIFFLLSCLLVTTNAFSADYPPEILGVWANAPEYCPQLEIKKKFAIFGTEETCEAISVKDSNSKFLIKEKCNGEGGSSTQTRTYSLNKDVLEISFGKSSSKHQRCGAEKIATAGGDKKNSGTSCKVNEGQAGVTTFLDSKLKKQGSSIRDFDGYEFKVDKKIKIDKTEILEGKLIRSDGTVAEQKSFAYAEEWTCK